MVEPWIHLHCPACDKQWETNPTDLPAPDRDFLCPDCETRDVIAAFMESDRGLEILRRFH